MEDLGDILKRLDREPVPDTRSRDRAIPTDELTSDCPQCRSRGWYTVDVPVTDPDFGLVVICECQEGRMDEEAQARLVRYSNLGQLARFTFDTLTPPTHGASEASTFFHTAKTQASQFAETPKGWIVLIGAHGSGKTQLAAAIANRCIERGHIALFVHVPDLMDHLRSSFGPTSEISYSELFDRVRATPLLVLDDLGGTVSTPWASEKLRQIVNHRFNAELPTVFTSSTEMQDIDPYLRARLETPDLSHILNLKAESTEQVLGQVPAELLKRMTLDSFDTRGNNPTAAQRTSLERALDAARDFASFPDGWLTLWGPTGVGKTHLAVAIAHEYLKRNQQVFFAFVPDLLDHLRSAYGPTSPVTYDQVFERVRNADLLILDDLGQEQGGPWAEEKLYQIIVHRHNLKLATVITTHDDFDGELGPIRSRANDKAVGYVVGMKAPDYRSKTRGTKRVKSKSRALAKGSSAEH